MKAIRKIVTRPSLAKSPRITYATGIMVVGRELAGHPPDVVPPQAFRAMEPICPACGYETSASFKWCPGSQGPYVEDSCHGMSNAQAPTLPHGNLRFAPHLHRQCQQCSYEWLEPCLEPDTVKFK